jgi:conjugative transposon TraM protein
MNTNKQDESKLKLSDKQKLQLKKYAVLGLLFIIFGASMYLIFAPSEEEKAKESVGFNADIPLPKDENIIGDKQDAYEQEQAKQKQIERMRSLADFGSLLDENSQRQSSGLSLIEDKASQPDSNLTVSLGRQPSIKQSADAYREMNRKLGSFYETPQKDPEKERLKKELEELKNSSYETPSPKEAMDNQLTLMEKSFQMAAKYLPMNGSTMSGTTESTATPKQGNATGKTAVIPVEQARERIVSALPQAIDAVDIFGKPRNLGFNTVSDGKQQTSKNSISACIHDDQTIMDGQNVRLRLLEAVQAKEMIIPRNTLVTGTAKIQGERLNILIHSLEYEKNIIPVEIRIYDSDGQLGIFIPNMQELDAAKEMVANMGTSVGTSISLSSDAKEQLLADMGRSVIQGTSQLFAKKVKEVKVHLKAGYQVLLVSPR